MDWQMENGFFSKHIKKIKLDLWLILKVKISSRWIKYLKTKYKIVKEWGIILNEIINNVEIDWFQKNQTYKGKEWIPIYKIII